MAKKHGPYLRRPKPGKIIKKVPGHFIRQWRERPSEKFPKGMTQPELAELAKMATTSISAYENGADPSFAAARKIAAALDITVGMLLDIDPNGDPALWDAYLEADKGQRASFRTHGGGFDPAQKKETTLSHLWGFGHPPRTPRH